ncbi:MAG: LuxR family transcriptional regulator [Anaerolineaceae bacterium]|nr:LuxR family transcriptional regulator [Anaerolineaceae bacterium]
MLETLLATKFNYPPVRDNLVARPRLVQQLALGGLRPFTLICAPAGYGKTTLVASGLTQAGQEPRVAWLSLDEDDNDPVRFWVYVIAALRRVAGGVGEQALALLQSPQPVPHTALTFLINDVAAQSEPLVLVLDDYHVIQNQSIHEGMVFLLDYLPPQLRLVMTSRADPPLPLARLRVRGQLHELRAADLRFTSVEAADFLQAVMGLPLTAADVQALEARTEGWIAGLQLAALSMQGVADLPGFIRAFSGSHRHLIDYLTEEVLVRQPELIQQFLLQTAVLDRFCAPLCEAVLETGDWRLEIDSQSPISNLQSLLEYLDRANLFLIPLDNERRWYRYHHLFVDLLRFRASVALDEAALRRIHKRAADWFAQQQLWQEAIRHALAAEEVALAGQLIAQQAATAVARGETDSLQAWLAALPAAQIQADPHLSLAQAWVELFFDRPETAETWLQPVLDSPEAIDDALLGEALAIRATLAFTRLDAAQTIADTEQALALLPETQLPLRTMLSWHLAFIYRSLGETRRSLALYHQTIEMSRRGGNFLINLSARRELADMLVGQGDLAAAQTMLNQLLTEAAAQGWMHLWPIPGVSVHLAEIAYEWNDLETAVTHLQTAVSHPEAVLIGFDAYGQALLARVYAAQGNPAAALETIQLAEQAVLQTTHAQRRVLTLAQISRFWLAQGDVTRAAAWLPDGRDVPQDPRHEVYARMQISHARYLLATCDEPQAAQLVADLLPAVEASGRVRDAVALWLLQAQLSGEVEGETAVQRALSLAEPAGLLRTFVDEGQPVAALLNKLSPTPYLNRILSAFARPESPPANRLLVEPLSERELEVLRLMAEGCSNREIADKLIFTIATAKKHAEHIYGKLGVNSRTQAIARAREIDLL